MESTMTMLKKNNKDAFLDLTKEQLVDGVGCILKEIDVPESKYPLHLHLNQHKLFTLFSVAFQSMLFLSSQSNTSGQYLIRLENGALGQKLSQKAKDESTRKFIVKLLIQRKLKYKESCFYLDYFSPNTWFPLAEIPKGRFQGVIIVSESSMRELGEEYAHLGEIPYYTLIKNFCDKSILIDLNKNQRFEEQIEPIIKVTIPIIGPKDEDVTLASGVSISKEIDLGTLI